MVMFAIAFAVLLVSFTLAANSLIAPLPSKAFAAVICLLFVILGMLFINASAVFQDQEVFCVSVVVLALSMFLRLTLFDNPSGDYNGFLSVWTSTMRELSVREVLVTPIGDYNMPYLYVLLAISRLPFSDLYCIKLFSVAADFAAALAIAKLAALITEQEKVRLAAFCVALLAPTTWLNSAYWGQCDSVYTAFALWGLFCGIAKHPRSSMVLFALALAFKLQAVFILPICIFLLVTGRVNLKQALLFPLAFLAVMLPALLAGRSLSDTFSIYFNQVQAYPYLSLNAPSLWSLIPNAYYNLLGSAPVILAGSITLLVLWLFLRKYEQLETTQLLMLSLLFSLLIPWLLPKMHERYFYLAEMQSILWAVLRPKDLPVTIILLAGGELIYSAYLFGAIPILSLQIIAVIYGLLCFYLFIRCIQQLYSISD